MALRVEGLAAHGARWPTAGDSSRRPTREGVHGRRLEEDPHQVRPVGIVVLDIAEARLEKARDFGADVTINNGAVDPVAAVMELTDGLGADVAIEAVGVPETFELCAELIRPGGRVANVGVHGHAAMLHLERLWIRGVTITTGLVDTFTTPKLMRLIAEGRLDPTPFATHRFELEETMEAYETFADAATTNALKVVLSGHPVHLEAAKETLVATG